MVRRIINNFESTRGTQGSRRNSWQKRTLVPWPRPKFRIDGTDHSLPARVVNPGFQETDLEGISFLWLNGNSGFLRERFGGARWRRRGGEEDPRQERKRIPAGDGDPFHYRE
jgi:hypothetical protein